MENQNMDAEKDTVIKWIKAHKKELILAGVGVVAVIGVILSCKNRTEVIDMWNFLKCKITHTAKFDASRISVKKEIGASVEPESILCTMGVDGDSPQLSKNIQEVSAHIRNLPDGRLASPEKQAAALLYGYCLEPGQTWVKSYTKGIIAA